MDELELDGFEWDSDKSERCLHERGFDFDYAARLFEGDFLEWEDRRRDYGEPRYVALGMVDDRAIVLVWTPRDRSRRIISARPASKAERSALDANRQTQ